MKRLMAVLAVTGLAACGKGNVQAPSVEPIPVATLQDDPIVPAGTDDFLDFVLADKASPDSLYAPRIVAGSTYARGMAYLNKTAAAGFPAPGYWSKIRWDAENIYLVEERAEIAFALSNAIWYRRHWSVNDGPEGGAWKSVGQIVRYIPGTCDVATSGKQPIYVKLLFRGPMDGRDDVVIAEYSANALIVREMMRMDKVIGPYHWSMIDVRAAASGSTYQSCTPDVF